MTYGPEIPIPDGKRPDWLRDDDVCKVSHGQHWLEAGVAIGWCWEPITAIRLLAGHPFYTVQRWNEAHPDEAPFVFLRVDGAAPGDYDGGQVLLRNGSIGYGNRWSRKGVADAAIGYRRKVDTPALPTYDPATHVLVERMTLARWYKFANTVKPTPGTKTISADCAYALGIILPDPDPIAEYAKAKGLDEVELRALVKEVKA